MFPVIFEYKHQCEDSTLTRQQQDNLLPSGQVIQEINIKIDLI